MSNTKRFVDTIKAGAIAKGPVKEILEAIKSDSELSAMETHLGVAFKDAESISNYPVLNPDDQVIVQKFTLYDENGDFKKNVIVWSPCSVENFFKMYGITVDDDGNYSNTINRDHRPSFLGKNIKKAFSSMENPDKIVKAFISSFVEGDFQLSNNVFYQMYMSNGTFTEIKVARDYQLSPKKVKKDA